MYKKADKRMIYHLMDAYLSGAIDESAFCNEFHCSYDLELDYDTLSKDEYTAFYELSEIASRFSESEEDHKKYPGVYFTKRDLHQKILENKRNSETIVAWNRSMQQASPCSIY